MAEETLTALALSILGQRDRIRAKLVEMELAGVTAGLEECADVVERIPIRSGGSYTVSPGRPQTILLQGYYPEQITLGAESTTLTVAPSKEAQRVAAPNKMAYLEYVDIEPIPDEYQEVKIATGSLSVGVVNNGVTAINISNLGFTPKYVHIYASSSVVPSSVSAYYLVSASAGDGIKTCQYAVKTSSTGTPTIYNRNTTSYPYVDIQEGGFKFIVVGFSLRCGTVKYVAVG